MIIIDHLLVLIFPQLTLRRVKSLMDRENMRAALMTLHTVIRVRPKNSEARLLAGKVCLKRNRHIAAIRHFSTIDQEDHLYSRAQFHLGRLSNVQGRVDQAIECFSQAVKNGLNTESVWICLCECYYRKKLFPSMRSCSEKILRLNPKSIEGHFFNGEAWRYLGDVKLAQKALQRVLDLDPNMFYAVESMAWMLRDFLGEEKSYEFLDGVITSKCESEKAPYLGLRGELLVRDCRFQEAEVSFREALLLSCNLKDVERARILTTLGVLLVYVSRVDEAFDCFTEALKIDPHFHVAKWHRSLVYLLKFNFSLAWNDYEYRKISGDTSVRLGPLKDWEGPGSVDSKLLIHAEQGLGDEIMFASCIPDLKTDVVECVIECDKKLVELYRHSFPWATIVDGDRSPFSLERISEAHPNLNCAIPVGSLPKYYRANDSWEPSSAYLIPSSGKVLSWKNKLDQFGNELKVGISWRGGMEATRASLRSIELSRWEKVLKIPNCLFINLQYGDTYEEIAQATENFGVNVINWQEALDDYYETAALVKALDLVVSVQTSIVHLSGAMGVKTLALIPFGPEWRYGSAGNQMRWYRSVKLLRQKKMGEWDEVMLDAIQEIKKVKLS